MSNTGGFGTGKVEIRVLSSVALGHCYYCMVTRSLLWCKTNQEIGNALPCTIRLFAVTAISTSATTVIALAFQLCEAASDSWYQGEAIHVLLFLFFYRSTFEILQESIDCVLPCSTCKRRIGFAKQGVNITTCFRAQELGRLPLSNNHLSSFPDNSLPTSSFKILASLRVSPSGPTRVGGSKFGINKLK